MSHIYSIVKYYGCQLIGYCGYCKTERGHSDHGMWLHYLTCSDYQDLIDRGWRRSGMYGYKPILWTACCPMFTIKCIAVDLKLSKSQKKLIKRFNRFIIHDERKKLVNREYQNIVSSEEMSYASRKCDKTLKVINDTGASSIQHINASSCSSSGDTNLKQQNVVSSNENKSSNRDFPTINEKRVNQNKKKFIRLERAKQRVMAKGKTEEEAMEVLKARRKMPKPKTIEERLKEYENINSKHKIETRVVQSSPKSEVFERTFEEEYKIYLKYQVVIHNDEPTKCNPEQFRRFLVRSPLEPQLINSPNCPIKSFGSYHQQYWLDDKLIAVGVIDILPLCVSSVYFFYDPDYSDLVLGTYGSMKELQFVRELQKYVPSLQNYYMGYYINSCTKMKYKARISPSYLLCPETFTWCPIAEAVEKISEHGVCRLNPDPTVKDNFESCNIDNVLVLAKDMVTKYGEYRRRFKSEDQKEVEEFAKAVGRKCAHSLILYRY